MFFYWFWLRDNHHIVRDSQTRRRYKRAYCESMAREWNKKAGRYYLSLSADGKNAKKVRKCWNKRIKCLEKADKYSAMAGKCK